MSDYPVHNFRFSISEALREFGFKIDSKENPCLAHGYYYKPYGEIFVMFLQSFFTNFQTDMYVYYIDPEEHVNRMLFYGVAPVNKKDFKTIMNYILPSEDFVSLLGMME